MGNISHACALQETGTVQCWGTQVLYLDSRNRELLEASKIPEDLSPAVQIATASNYTCILELTGKLRCWGSYANREPMIIPTDLKHMIQISSADTYTCVLEEHGTVQCWGDVPEHVRAQLLKLDSAVQVSTGFRSCLKSLSS